MTDQLTSALQPLRNFFSKHHAVLFICFITLLLAYAIFMLYEVLTTSNPPLTDSTSTMSQFDQETIDKIKKLHNSTDRADTLVLPSPRANPFVE